MAADAEPARDAGERYGAIEAGGTKFICAIGDRAGHILHETRIETRDPQTTLGEVLRYFETLRRVLGPLQALGIGSFGPLDLTRGSPTFGFITSTPKPGWAGTDMAGTVERGLGVRTCIDTDVNAAALAEYRWGSARGLGSVAYVTVGTGIGVGVVHHGRAIHGIMHPELGHMSVRRHLSDTQFAGSCPYHGDCLEGLACGPAIIARTGGELSRLPASAPMWDIEADYLGQLCAMLVLSHAPHRIVMGGGVMHPDLFAPIRQRMRSWLRDYIKVDALRADDYVAPPALGEAAGVMGALALALMP